jgi:hypothetical protein
MIFFRGLDPIFIKLTRPNDMVPKFRLKTLVKFLGTNMRVLQHFPSKKKFHPRNCYFNNTVNGSKQVYTY